jgi:AcrR family transcriptional regulator
MPRISVQKQQDRYDTILHAARLVLAEKGYEAASIGDIAAAANVSDGLIYRYFDGKRNLLMAVLGEFYRRVIQELDEAVNREQGFRPRLRALVNKHTEVFAADAELCRLFLTQIRVASDYRGSQIYQLNRRYTAILLRLVETGIAEGQLRHGVDPRVLRDMLFGGIEHLAWRHISGGNTGNLARGGDQIANVLLDGICRVPA